MARPLNRKALILLILAAGLGMLFFSHYKERTPLLQLEAMQANIAATESPAEKMRQEFELGRHYEKLGQYQQAFEMFQRVRGSYPYPDIHYGYLQDEATWKMQEYTQNGWVGDTTSR